ncbi:MAG: ParB/RepB/Spo0J family partition protein [Deltaproteobacteria bacterium]|jgi:ParB/RepB/Spo0J family partition protein|nr:ParB/RepB/Spo0J family partition protein [Deltaproteobacteria bacterium]
MPKSKQEPISDKIIVSDAVLAIPIALIQPDPRQPRKIFDSETLNNLKNSIGANSLLDPILVRENEEKNGFYIIVDGERRWRACQELNFANIKCRVVSSDSEGYKIVALTQNLHRDDLLPIEKANAFAQLLSKMQGENENVKQSELMKIVNLSENYISEILKISTLDDAIKEEALKSNKWSINRLLQLAKIKSQDLRMKKFNEFKAVIGRKREGRREIGGKGEKIISRGKNSADTATQDKKIARLNSRADIFALFLEKFVKIKFDDAEKEIITPNLDKIQKLINKVLS